MGSKTLHIFNPEHDYALAVGNAGYTLPPKVEALRRKFTLLPSIYADGGDFILIPDNFITEDELHKESLELIQEKKICLIKESNLSVYAPQFSRILPWGWNHHLRRKLSSLGIPDNLIPSSDKINIIRNLSHRRTVIPFRKTLFHYLGEDDSNPVKELKNIKDVEAFLSANPYSYFKAPWSSSGRGVVSSSHISRNGLFEWAHGAIRRQGSIIAEPGWERALDFATEWVVRQGRAEFLGLSVFETSSRGKYHGNLALSQAELLELITTRAPQFGSKYIEVQAEALNSHISPFYSGPVGIDMLCDIDGKINPCVEINLRMTMGHINLLKQNRTFYPRMFS